MGDLFSWCCLGIIVLFLVTVFLGWYSKECWYRDADWLASRGWHVGLQSSKELGIIKVEVSKGYVSFEKIVPWRRTTPYPYEPILDAMRWERDKVKGK